MYRSLQGADPSGFGAVGGDPSGFGAAGGLLILILITNTITMTNTKTDASTDTHANRPIGLRPASPTGAAAAAAAAAGRSPASKRGQDKRLFCRSAAIYHNYCIIMALLWEFMALL